MSDNVKCWGSGMPDDDRIYWSLGRGWRRVARAFEAGSPIESVTDRVMSALSAYIRETGGVPALRQIASATVAAARAGGERLHCGQLAASPPGVAGNEAMALRRANVFLSVDGPGVRASSVPEFEHRLAESFLASVARRDGLDRIGPREVRGGRIKLPEFRDQVQRILESRQFSRLAASLVRHPDGRGLRAPARLVKPSGTAALLHRPLAMS